MSRNLATFALLCAAFLVAIPSASAVTIDWTAVGNPGNNPDLTPKPSYGAVEYSFKISKYSVTNSQYMEFLNAKDPTGANALQIYDSNMGEKAVHGGITYTAGNANGAKYSILPGRQNYPVNSVNWYSALRFSNWLNNGQGNGDTETGAYTLLGGAPTPTNATTIKRNAGANLFLPSEDEWYKAAYYNPATSSYFLQGTGTNTAPTAGAPTAMPNYANFNNFNKDFTPVGSYTGTTSPYGAYDMAGNISEWTETLINNGGAKDAVMRNGFYDLGQNSITSADRYPNNPAVAAFYYGFRVAAVPEPSTFVMGALGVLVLFATRRFRANQ